MDKIDLRWLGIIAGLLIILLLTVIIPSVINIIGDIIFEIKYYFWKKK